MKFFATLHRVLGTQNFLMLNYPFELPPQKRYDEQRLIHVEATFKRRLLHNELGAVVGLSGYMAGLRFLYERVLLLLKPEGITNNKP